jgi:hypothetical protein
MQIMVQTTPHAADAPASIPGNFFHADENAQRILGLCRPDCDRFAPNAVQALAARL